MQPSTPEAPDGKPEGDRFRLLVETVADYAIYMLDPAGFVTSWNAGASRLKGYTPDEIIGQHYSHFFTAEDQAAGVPARNLAEAKSTGRYESEGWRVRKDGTRFWVLAVLQALRDPSGRLIGFAKITRDMTERYAAQQALLESERRFRLLIENVVDYAIYMLDPSGIVINWNAGAEWIKGYTADEIVGNHFSRFYTKEDRAAGLPARVLDIAAREGRYEAEGWRLRKDGGRFRASVVIDAIRDETGELIGFAKITRDITERQAAQQALLESERQFRLLMDSVTDYALFMLDPNGIVSTWNKGAERIKGYTADEIVGQHFSRFHTDQDRLAGIPARSLQIASEQGRFEAEAWRVRKDGSLFWANLVIDPIRDDKGQIIGFAKITRDITERRAAQKALQEAQAQLAQAQKMEALGQLTGGVAHDFNNLLMVVSGHLHTLKELIADDAKGRRAAVAIEIAVQRGTSLTHQLLTFSRRQSVNPVTIKLQEAMETIRTMLTSSIGGSVGLATTILPEVWPVRVDLSELELAIVNLAVNARDAMPEGGVVTIAAENVRLERGDTPQDIAGEFVALTVADTGHGIPADILPKVFDPFFTTKRPNKGTGLGLSQVHGFAHQSGGTVAVRSEVGKGTCVTLYLPRAALEPSAPTLEREEPALARGGSVLLVEDNPDVAQVSKDMLEQLGYQVTAVADAAAALQTLEENRFDIVLTDIIMAGSLNGIGLARVVRERHPTLPIVLATGYSNAAADAANEFVVLRKPYRLADLSRTLARLITQRQRTASSINLVSFQDAKRERRLKTDPSSSE